MNLNDDTIKGTHYVPKNCELIAHIKRRDIYTKLRVC